MRADTTILNPSRQDISALMGKLRSVVDSISILYETPHDKISSEFLIIISDDCSNINIENFYDLIVFYIGSSRFRICEDHVIYNAKSLDSAIEDIIHHIHIIRHCSDTDESRKFVIELLKENNYLKNIAQTDYLTKAYNKRYLMNNIKLKKCSLICMLDIDNFKSINDNIGHVASDNVLRNTTEIIFDGLLKEENLVRFGGDEFIIISECNEINVFSERISSICERIYQFFIKQNLVIKISYGIVESKNFNNILEAIAAADQEMYRKRCHEISTLTKI